jgi:Zn-dependent protease
MDPDSIIAMAARIPVLLLALTVHECGHALMAKWCGDDTAERLGRITLNPMAHLTLLGTLCLMFAPVGWAKPVPVNPLRFRHPRRDDILVSLAGPFGNLIQLPFYALLWHVIASPLGSALPAQWLHFLALAAYLGVIINISLMLFNLLPVFPLDGSHVLLNLLPEQQARPLYEFQMQYGPMLLMALIVLSFQTGLLSAYISLVGRPITYLLGMGGIL